MAASMIPYGRLADGKYGILVDNVTDKPLASVIEVLDTLPGVDDSSNFPGRVVFEASTGQPFAFTNKPANSWILIEGVPCQVEHVNGNITSPGVLIGELFYDLDTKNLYVWNDFEWQLATYEFPSGIQTVKFDGDGTTTSFNLPIKWTTPTATIQVAVFLNGFRQIQRNAITNGDFDLIGNKIVFNTAPVIGAVISVTIRKVTDFRKNTDISRQTFIATYGDRSYSAGGTRLTNGRVFVSVNGILYTPTIDYNISTMNTDVVRITVSNTVEVPPVGFAGFALIQFAQHHNMPVGYQFSLYGYNSGRIHRTEYLHVSRVVDQFTVEVPYATYVPNPFNLDDTETYYAFPAVKFDTINFARPFNGGERIEIITVSDFYGTEPVGEINTMMSLGGGESVYAGKVGATFNIKSLLGNERIHMTYTDGEVVINDACATAYETVTTVESNFYNVQQSDTCILVNSTVSSPVSVNLTNLQVPENAGKRITIKDSGGNSTANNISLFSPGATIDGISPFVMNHNYSSVTLLYDGVNWEIISYFPEALLPASSVVSFIVDAYYYTFTSPVDAYLGAPSDLASTAFSLSNSGKTVTSLGQHSDPTAPSYGYEVSTIVGSFVNSGQYYMEFHVDRFFQEVFGGSPVPTQDQYSFIHVGLSLSPKTSDGTDRMIPYKNIFYAAQSYRFAGDASPIETSVQGHALQVDTSTSDQTYKRVGISTISAGDTIMMAVDVSAGNIWFGVNGTWDSGYPSAVTDPSNGLNPFFEFPVGIQVSPWVRLNVSNAITLRNNAADYAYAPPTGFVPFPKVDKSEWSSTSKSSNAIVDNIDLGHRNNYDLLRTGPNAFEWARWKTPLPSTGRYYWEMFPASVGNTTSPLIALVKNTVNLNVALTGDTNDQLIFLPNGTLRYNGVSQSIYNYDGSYYGYNADNILFALNADTGQLWIAINHGQPPTDSVHGRWQPNSGDPIFGIRPTVVLDPGTWYIAAQLKDNDDQISFALACNRDDDYTDSTKNVHPVSFSVPVNEYYKDTLTETFSTSFTRYTGVVPYGYRVFSI